MKDLKALLEQHTNEDGQIDYDVVQEAVNEEINNIVAKNKPNTEKLKEELKSEVAKEIIGGLGIDGESVEDLKLWSKKMGGNTDEVKEQNVLLENELKKAQEELNAISEAKQTLEADLSNRERLSKIKEYGVHDNDTAEFVKFKLDKLVDDTTDFDTALEQFRQESPNYFRQKEVTTFRRFPDAEKSTADEKDADVLRAFEEKHKK